jgi:Flp pilus assembly protein TadD
VATEEAALGFAILYRHLFGNRQALEIPTTLLLDAEGRVVKVYRDRMDVSLIQEDASRIEAPPHERLARALPFPGTFYSAPAGRSYVPYGRELLDQGLESQAVVAFELAARGNPTAASLFRLGNLLVKTGQTTKARDAFERALALQPDLSEASNDLGALLAESGDIEGAIARFQKALDATPDYPDALNNLGYALLLEGQGAQARRLYERALELQPDFPEALNNLGLILGQSGALEQAEPYFRQALEKRPDYAEAANNLALVLVARGEPDQAIGLLQGFLASNPDSSDAYITLAKVYLSLDRREEGLEVLDRLLEREPDHPLALEMARQFR